MTYISGFQGNFNPAASVVIANAAQSSSVLKTGGLTLCGFFIPAAFTGTALTFEACSTVDGTFVPLKTSGGSALSFTVAASGYYAVDPKDFQGVAFLKLKSGSAEGAARTIICSLKGF